MSKAPEATIPPAVNIFVGAETHDFVSKHANNGMGDDEVALLRQSYGEGFNQVTPIDRGVVMGTIAHRGHDQADGLVTSTATQALSSELQAAKFEGATNLEAVDAMYRAGFRASEAVSGAKDAKSQSDPTWADGVASLSAVRVFRNNDGDQCAAILNAGDNYIARVRKDPINDTFVLESVASPTMNAVGDPVNPIDGTNYDPEVRVVSVEPTDRFVVIDKAMAVDEGNSKATTPISHDAVAEAAANAPTAKQAAANLAKLPKVTADAMGGQTSEYLADASVAVVDVDEHPTKGDWSRADKILRPVTKLWVKMQIAREDRVVKARERYEEIPSKRNRMLLAATDAGVWAVGLTTAVMGARFAGIAVHHLFEGQEGNVAAAASAAAQPTPSTHNAADLFNNLHGSSAPSHDVTTAASHATAHPEITHNDTPTPHASASASAHASASPSTHHSSAAPHPSHSGSAHPSHKASPTPAHSHANGNSVVPGTTEHHHGDAAAAGAGAVNLDHLDPNHLPSSVHLTADEKAWLNARHNEGQIGAFTGHAGADGLGHPGTVWHNAMKSLQEAGYDPKKLSTDEQGQYMKYVLSLNHHMTLQQAANQHDNFVPVMPTNGDIISHITRITAHNHGGPLMPAANSPAGIHLSQIQHTVESQVHTGAHSGTGTGTTPAPRSTYHPGGTVPTTAPTPHPATSTPHTTATPHVSASTPHTAHTHSSAAATHPSTAASSHNAAPATAGSHSAETVLAQEQHSDHKTALAVVAATAIGLAGSGVGYVKRHDLRDALERRVRHPEVPATEEEFMKDWGDEVPNRTGVLKATLAAQAAQRQQQEEAAKAERRANSDDEDDDSDSKSATTTPKGPVLSGPVLPPVRLRRSHTGGNLPPSSGR